MWFTLSTRELGDDRPEGMEGELVLRPCLAGVPPWRAAEDRECREEPSDKKWADSLGKSRRPGQGLPRGAPSAW